MERDTAIRHQAFAFVERLRLLHGDALPWGPLATEFVFDGMRIPLLGQRGIWKPAALDLPISITTSPKDPYGDKLHDDGFLHYRYFGTNPVHPDNAGLRRAMHEEIPLIYFHGISTGVYSALWPAFIVADDPGTLTFTVACEDVQMIRPDVPADAGGEIRRAYVTRLAVQRLHQTAFRQRVLRAYQTRCAVCTLRHAPLLDAAHILADGHERGQPIVANGLSMCKIHHAAFDANILGIRPDAVVEIRSDVLAEIDGPMLRYGLQQHHGDVLHLPRAAIDRPDRDRLEIRYHEFRRAS